jgi:sporulation integral membrane protein YtvI
MERRRTPWAKALELPALLIFTVLLLILALKLIRYIAPVLIAGVLALVMEPMIRFLSGKRDARGSVMRRGLPRKLAVIAAMLLLFSILALLFALLIAGIADQLIRLSESLPQTVPQLSERIADLVDSLKARALFVSPATLEALTRMLNIVGQRLMEALGLLAANLLGGVTRLPSLMLFIVVMVLSTYFIASDRHRLFAAVAKQLPLNWLLVLFRLNNTLLKALWGWICAQLLIMMFMFALLFIGLWILRVPFALLIAACVAVLDALPVLGSGLALLPWSAYHIVFGQKSLGIGLLILYLIVTTFRQIIEPRIVGVRFGLPPLVTMAAMYAGLRLTGFLGLLLGPVFTLILLSVARAYLDGRTYREILGFG